MAMSSDPKSSSREPMASDKKVEMGTDGSDIENAPKETNIQEEDDNEYPSNKVVVPALISGYFVVFLVALDRTIIGTAIPSISNEFQSFGDIAWYEAGFLLPLCVFGLSFGRLLTFYSTKWIIIIEIVIFEIGNLICALAPSSSVLIAGRVITGIGAVGIFASFLVLINTLLPLSKRPKWSGGLGACFGLSSILGPLIGGYLTAITWRWIFWINLPIGGLALIIFIVATPNTKPPDAVAESLVGKIKQLDPVGFFLLAPAVVTIIFALQWGGIRYPWNDARIITLFVLFGVLGIAFICSQAFLKGGTIQKDVITQRSVIASLIQSITIGSLLIVYSFYLPIYFQAIKDNTPQQSGISILGLLLSTVVFVISSGIGISTLGYYTPFAIAGGALLVVGSALISTWKVDTPPGMWIGYQIITGAGLGLSLQQPNIAVQTVLSKEKAPNGLALLQFVQFLFGSILITVCQTLLQTKLANSLAPLGIDGFAIATGGATSLRSLVSEEQLPEVLVLYNEALKDVWYLALALCVLTFLAAFGYENKNVKEEEAKAKKAERERKSQQASDDNTDTEKA